MTERYREQNEAFARNKTAASRYVLLIKDIYFGAVALFIISYIFFDIMRIIEKIWIKYWRKKKAEKKI